MNFVLESCKSLQTQKNLVIFLKDWYLNLYLFIYFLFKYLNLY